MSYKPNTSHLNFISRWNHPLILTIDPNFQRDIQVIMARGSLFTVKLWVSNHEVVPQAECCSSGCGHSTGNLAMLKPLKSAGWVAVLKDYDPKMYTMNIPISILFRIRLLVIQTSLVFKKKVPKKTMQIYYPIPKSIKKNLFNNKNTHLLIRKKHSGRLSVERKTSTCFFLGQTADLEVV